MSYNPHQEPTVRHQHAPGSLPQQPASPGQLPNQPYPNQYPDGYQYQHANPYQPGMPHQPKSTNGLAITSLILGIITLLFGAVFTFIAIPFSIGGIVAGVVGRRQIRDNDNQDGDGLAIGGIVTNVLALLLQIAIIALTIIVFGSLLWFASNDAFCDGPDDLDCISTSTTLNP